MPRPDPLPADLVTVVTGAARHPGRELARGLAARGSAVVVVYLRDRAGGEAVVDAILAARGVALGVRADVADPLDVERVFDEAVLAFGGVDVVVHAADRGAAVVLREAARRLRGGGLVVTLGSAADVPAALVRELRAGGVAVHRAAPAAGPAERDDAVAAIVAALARR